MRVRTFYQACEESALLDSLQGSNANFEFAKVISKLCGLMQHERDIDVLSAVLQTELTERIKSEWFRFSFQKEQTIQDDVLKFQRFYNWLSLKDKEKVVDANVSTEVSVLNNTYSSVVNLIIEREDCSYEGIIIQVGKNPFSFKGRTTHTKAENNLYALIPKYILEGMYNGIVMSCVYLTQDKDSLGDVKEHFLISQGKGSNVHRLYFEDCYSGGVFDEEELFNRIAQIVSTPVDKNCYMCRNARMCNSQTLSNKPKEEVVEVGSYKLPEFTTSQMEVVSHEKGPMLVIACPGSGKTAALVGRIKALKDKGIDTDYMLVITFTKEAKKELEKRVSSFCDDKNLPTISTIHALAYKILRDNADVIGREYNLLTKKEKLSIVANLIEATHPKGFNYSVTEGRYGTVETVGRALDEYVQLNDKEAFFSKEKDLGADFEEIAEYYKTILEERNYISFDEQITLCNKFLKDYPEICSSYNSIYQYLMVDEYQDIDENQHEFILLLSKHHNIVAVGDDDQNIYGFRGGTNKYMLTFREYHEGAKILTFSENFRSTEALIKASNTMIEANRNRYSKQMVAVRKGGLEPVYINGNEPELVQKAIDEAISCGYSYGDIAVLSQKNATLEGLKERLKAPCVLEKSYLINEPLFVCCFYPLALLKSDYQDNLAMLHLCRMFDIPLERTGLSSLYEAVKHNTDENSHRLLDFIENIKVLTDYPAKDYVRAVASMLDLDGTKAHEVINEVIKENELKSLSDLFKLFDEMVLYEDDTRVSIANVDAVLLITNHESKGKEYPVVILVGDSEPTTEEARRVLYVAMTRAKNMLFVLNKAQEVKKAI